MFDRGSATANPLLCDFFAGCAERMAAAELWRELAALR
jgi:hypothetical protein